MNLDPAMSFLGSVRTIALRLSPGQDLLRSVEGAAEAMGIRTAFLMGIGGLRVGRLGVFDGKGYTPKEIRPRGEGAVEIASLLGNITVKDGRPFAHVHAVLSNGEEVLAGHLLEGSEVWPTAEIVFLATQGEIRRVRDPELGYFRWDI